MGLVFVSEISGVGPAPPPLRGAGLPLCGMDELVEYGVDEGSDFHIGGICANFEVFP